MFVIEKDDDVNNNTSVENEKTEKQENTAKTTSNKKLPKTGM